MPSNEEIRFQLEDSLRDYLLSRDEKAAFVALFSEIRGEQARFARNVAFDLVRAKLDQVPPVASASGNSALLRWLESLIKTLENTSSFDLNPRPVCFSPGNDCRDRILNLFREARRMVDVCVFTISDDRITEEIIRAHHRSVAIRIVTDDRKSDDAGSDIDRLTASGVPLRMDRSRYHMHHKFAIFDGQYLLNGSFNWTRSASDYNQENVVSYTDRFLINEFQGVFEQLWRRYSIE